MRHISVSFVSVCCFWLPSATCTLIFASDACTVGAKLGACLPACLPRINCTCLSPPPPAAILRVACAGKTKGGKLKGEETAVIDQVAIIGSGKDKGLKQANIKLRFNRNPVIGEPFGTAGGGGRGVRPW